MRDLHTIARYPAVALALILCSPVHAVDIRIACDDSDNRDARMSARYIHTPGRALFDVSYKAPASTDLDAREALEVRVNGYVVGYAELAPRGPGKMGASLSFDSYANEGIADNPKITAFPASWPGSLPPQPIGIGAGSRIMIGSLGCTLQ